MRRHDNNSIVSKKDTLLYITLTLALDHHNQYHLSNPSCSLCQIAYSHFFVSDDSGGVSTFARFAAEACAVAVPANM